MLLKKIILFLNDKFLVFDSSTIRSLGWKPKNDIYKLAEIMLADGE
jgi:hypothetical protein